MGTDQKRKTAPEGAVELSHMRNAYVVLRLRRDTSPKTAPPAKSRGKPAGKGTTVVEAVKDEPTTVALSGPGDPFPAIGIPQLS